LGFCNFYWRFIKGFTRVSKPLTELTGKREWRWSDKEKGAFRKPKDLISITPVLVISNTNQRFQIEVDASGYTIEGVLSQHQPDGS